MAILKRDVFGHFLLVKRLMVVFFGVFAYARFNLINKTKIEGSENLLGLANKNVLFVSNHQTYFSDVAMFFMVFAAVKNGQMNSIKWPFYLLRPRLKIYFVAAVETMKSGLLPKIFTYAGSISIKRTWREAGKEIKRQVDMRDITNIGKALSDGWVITFPQGTTRPFQKGRKGTSHIVKKYDPVVVPIVIDGFRRAFDRKGLRLKKKGVTLKVRIKKPLNLNAEDPADKIMDGIMTAIEQAPEFSHFPLDREN